MTKGQETVGFFTGLLFMGRNLTFLKVSTNRNAPKNRVVNKKRNRDNLRIMSAPAILTRDEYHLRIRQSVDALKARMSLPAYFTSTNKRDKVLFYFMGRAAEIGEASFRISDLHKNVQLCRRR